MSKAQFLVSSKFDIFKIINCPRSLIRQILDLLFRRRTLPTGSIIEQEANDSGNTSEKEEKIQETSQKGIVDSILEELESNSGKPDLLKLGDVLLDMSIAISKGLKVEELIVIDIERIRQRWKKEIEMGKDPSQSEIGEVEYFHKSVIAISEFKGRLYRSCAFSVPELYGTKIHFSNKEGKIIMHFDKYSCSDPIQQSNLPINCTVTDLPIKK